MLKAAIRRAALVGLLALSAACGGSETTAPTAPTSTPVVPSQPPPPPPLVRRDFPPLSGPFRTFVFEQGTGRRVSDYTRQSRFLLYDNRAFALQYPSPPPGGEYRGEYSESNGVITFEWKDSWNAAFPWGATGRLQDGLLTVQYNLMMQMTDFEDAAYRLTQQ
jgi:hypothetical protein